MRGRLARLLGLAIFLFPFVAGAQTSGKLWRMTVRTSDRPGTVEALVEGLRELNYVEGRNLLLDHRRFATPAELPGIAAEIVRRNPDVIVTGHGSAASALKRATPTIPIVLASSADAVAQGLIASLARPGGNITGFTNMAPDLAANRLGFLKEAVPQASRIAVLGCPDVERPSTKAGENGRECLLRRNGWD